MVKRILACLFVSVICLSSVGAQQPTEPPRDQYQSIDELPPFERTPSAPYVVAAYALIWALGMFYLWTIWRRAGKLEEDMQSLARRQKDAAR